MDANGAKDFWHIQIIINVMVWWINEVRDDEFQWLGIHDLVDVNTVKLMEAIKMNMCVTI